jgi:hypothetical protein
MISKRRFQIALFIAAALTAGCEAQNQPPTPSPVPNTEPRKIDVDRPVERAGRNLSGNIEKWRQLRNPDQGFGQAANLPRNREERRYFIREKREGRDHSFRKRRADRNEMARGQKALFGDPEEPRILPGLIGSLQLI